MPTWDERDTIDILVKVLEPFSTLTDALSGQQTVTCTGVLPALAMINLACAHEEDESELAIKIKDHIKEYISTRWVRIEVNSVGRPITTGHVPCVVLSFLLCCRFMEPSIREMLLQCTALDPRYKLTYAVDEEVGPTKSKLIQMMVAVMADEGEPADVRPAEDATIGKLTP